MRQYSYGRDTGLTFRMFFTMFMLAGLWVVFMGLLFWAGISPILIFGFALVGMLVQYFMSDKLVLMSTGAREVTAQEEPWLHATIERLAQMYEIPKPRKIAVMDTHVPNAFATGRNPGNAVEDGLDHEMAHVKNREYSADRGGAVVTGTPMQLASALAKISNDMYRIPDEDLRDVRHASAFMFVPALSGNGIARLFSSHPPTEKRIERLQNMQRELERSRQFRISLSLDA